MNNTVVRFLPLYFISIVALNALATAQEIPAASDPGISNIQVDGQTPTIFVSTVTPILVSHVDSAVITWTTTAPTTGQVLLYGKSVGDCAQAGAAQLYPFHPNPQLTTTHSVGMKGLPPNNAICFRIISGDRTGQGWTSPATNAGVLGFQTASEDANAPKRFRLNPEGSKNVYAGSNLYLGVTTTLLAGNDDDYAYLNPPVITDAAHNTVSSSVIGTHYVCDENLYAGVDSVKDTMVDGNGNLLCYRLSYPMFLKFEPQPGTPPGQYTAAFSLTETGVTYGTTWNFTVLPPAAPVQRIPIASVPPLDPVAMARWQTRMLADGARFCVPGEFMAFGYEEQIWYYDGGRSYLQIGDYTGDKKTWYPCAQNILNQFADRNIPSGIQGWRLTPHGLTEVYWRFRDLHAEAALMNMYGTPYVQTVRIRETAYAIDAAVKKAQVNHTPPDPHMVQMVDWGLGHFDELFVSNQNQSNQPFYDGIMAEALIQYYEYTNALGAPDNRIPPAIKQMMDWLWAHAVVTNPTDPYYGHTMYNALSNYGYVPSIGLGQIYSGLNDLMSPAWAWYWNLTGDNTYLLEGDVLFNHNLDDDATGIYDGKQFNQHFKWSFDYVHYRSSATPVVSLTDPSNNPPDLSYVYDTTPPVISGIQVSGITASGATVTWTTDVNSSTWSQYGTATTYTVYTPSVNGPNDSAQNMTQNHVLSLTGLLPNTTYHFIVMSRDSIGNNAISADQTFMTTN